MITEKVCNVQPCSTEHFALPQKLLRPYYVWCTFLWQYGITAVPGSIPYNYSYGITAPLLQVPESGSVRTHSALQYVTVKPFAVAEVFRRDLVAGLRDTGYRVLCLFTQAGHD